MDAERHAVTRELVDRLTDGLGVKSDSIVLDGFAPERLAALAGEWRADEIVLGSRGLGRCAATLGSVSHALLEPAELPA